MNAEHLSILFVLIITLGISLCTSQNSFLSVLALTPVGPTSIVEGKISAVPEKDLDKFGIEMIYPTKTGGEQWFINMVNPVADGRFDPQDKITRNSDGSWKMKSDKVRMSVYTSRGYHLGDISKTQTHDELMKRGYMQSTSDWKNVEITGYVKLNSYTHNDNFVWYTRGGKHTDADPCEGAGYKGNLDYNGKVQFSKEQWHVSYVKSPYKQVMGSLQGKWIGFKFVEYNFNNTQETQTLQPVKLEIWVDPDADGTNWKKVYEGGDAGRWGRSGESCRGAPDQIIGWGGPVASYRWDFASDVDFKDFSVREIVPVGGITSNIGFFDGAKSGYGDGSVGSNSSHSIVDPGNLYAPSGKKVAQRNNDTGLEISSIPKLLIRNDSEGVKTPSQRNEDKTLRVGNTTYVIWAEGDEDNTDIYMKISHNNGLSFSDPINLSNNPASLSYNPDIEESNGNVYIVWEDDSGISGNTDIFFIKSSDGGATFSERKNLSNDPSGSGEPRISVLNGNIYVTWMGTTPDKPGLSVRESKDNGETFSNGIDLNQNLREAPNEASNSSYSRYPSSSSTLMLNTINNNDTAVAFVKDTVPDVRYNTLTNNLTEGSRSAIYIGGIANATYNQKNITSSGSAYSSDNSKDMRSPEILLQPGMTNMSVRVDMLRHPIHFINLSDTALESQGIEKVEQPENSIDILNSTNMRLNTDLTKKENNVSNYLKEPVQSANDVALRVQAKNALLRAEHNFDNFSSSSSNRNDLHPNPAIEISLSNAGLKAWEEKERQVKNVAPPQSRNTLIQERTFAYSPQYDPASNALNKAPKLSNQSQLAMASLDITSYRRPQERIGHILGEDKSPAPTISIDKQTESQSSVDTLSNQDGQRLIFDPAPKDQAIPNVLTTKLIKSKDVQIPGHTNQKIPRNDKITTMPTVGQHDLNKQKDYHNATKAAKKDKIITFQGKPFRIELSGKDKEGIVNPPTFKIVNRPHHARIDSIDTHKGKLNSTPDKTYAAQDSFKYSVSGERSSNTPETISLEIDRTQTAEKKLSQPKIANQNGHDLQYKQIPREKQGGYEVGSKEKVARGTSTAGKNDDVLVREIENQGDTSGSPNEKSHVKKSVGIHYLRQTNM